jgi:transposase
MPHHRARFTPRGRELVVRRVVDDGETFAQAAAWVNVSKSTVWEWVRRWRAAPAAERESLACLADRSSRPHRSPARLPADEETRICELRRRTACNDRRREEAVRAFRAYRSFRPRSDRLWLVRSGGG